MSYKNITLNKESNLGFITIKREKEKTHLILKHPKKYIMV